MLPNITHLKKQKKAKINLYFMSNICLEFVVTNAGMLAPKMKFSNYKYIKPYSFGSTKTVVYICESLWVTFFASRPLLELCHFDGPYPPFEVCSFRFGHNCKTDETVKKCVRSRRAPILRRSRRQQGRLGRRSASAKISRMPFNDRAGLSPH